MNRIKDKIEELEDYLQELSEIIPSDFEEYKHDFKLKAACERYFERIITAVIDLAFILIKRFRLKTPEEEKQAFDILFDEKIISENLKEKLQEAKGMRNIIAHEYGKVNDEFVFDSIKDEIILDVKSFIKSVKGFLKNN